MISFRKILSAIIVVTAFNQTIQAQNQKLRVDDPTVAARMLARGGKLVANYGAFQIIQADVASSAGESNRVESAEESNFIELHAARLDTRTSATKLLRKTRGSFRGRQLHLVQFAAPVKPEWREEMLATGIKIISYVPQNAYLVYGDAAALARLQTWAGTNEVVQWEGAYNDEWKINPAARTTNAVGQARSPGTSTFAIQLVEDPTANSNTLAQVDALKLAPAQRESRVLGYRNIFVELPPEKLSELATNGDVISIQPYFPRKKFCERQAQIMAGNLSGNLPSGPGYLAWLAGRGFTQAQFDASGFVVDVSDSGIDNGTTSPNHFGLHLGGTNALASRVIYNRLEGTPNAGSTLQGCDGHGNLNAHIIGGYDNLSGSPFADASGYHYGLGICPFVKIGSSVVFDSSDFTSPNYDNLMSRAYRDGARVSNNSWGGATAGGYDADAQNYDALVRDAQPSGSDVAAAGNQEMVIVFAAGNDGSAASTVGSPGTGKNIICVGAGENVQPFGGSDGSGVADSGANSANDIISFSSHGPCADGRFKPDLCAPGTHISGGVAQSNNPSATGTAIACFDGTGVSGGTGGSSFFPAGQQFYTASSGTSHATPGIAGACALLRQFFINQNLTPPSPAMTKAYLVNSTRYMTGTGAGGTLPSNSQGMGAINLGTAFDGVTRVLRDEADLFTASGQTRQFSGNINDAAKPFRVTLAWTDAPGSTTGNAYNNNLDLTVTVGTNIYKGNVFSGANSITGGTNDIKNNLESVFLPAGVATNFTVTVTAANINSDGVPGNASALDQDFALVIYNALTNSIPLINGQPASQTNALGGAVTFTAAAAGAPPLAYQWFFTNAISGATNSSLVISNVAATNAGNYFVIVTNSFGSATSALAKLTVTLVPVITQSPSNQSVLTGQPAGFNVVALGAPTLAYQWRKNSTNIAGANATNYFLASVTAGDAGSYDVVVTNFSGSVTSSVAMLTVINPSSYSGVLAGWDMNSLSGFGPTPFAPTTNAPNVQAGGLTRGSGVATGQTAASRGWGGSGFSSASAASSYSANAYATFTIAVSNGYTLSFTSLNKYDYRRSSGGPTAGLLQYKVGSGAFTDVTTFSYSSSANAGASLGVTDLSGIAALQNIPAGTNVTFIIVNYGASSSSGNWYIYDRVTPGVNDFEISGSLAPVAIVTPPPVITVPPSPTNVFAGNNARFSVTATGSGTLNYQWLKNEGVLANGGAISGAQANALNFIPAATNHIANYSVIVTNLGGGVTSSAAALNVVSVPTLSFSNSSGMFLLNAAGGAVSNSFIVQMTTNLVSPAWISLQTNLIGTNGQMRFTETNPVSPFRFYRLLFP